MITYLRHEEIDPDVWEHNLAACANSSWYGSYGALEAAAPGWDALVDAQSGACMPLPQRSKYGIHYLFQPFMVQHIGPFTPRPDDEQAARFLQALPARFKYADICLEALSIPQLPHLRTERRANYLLLLDRPEDVLRANYSENHRRSLRKAHQLGVEVESRAASGEVIAFIEGSEQFRKWRVDGAARTAMRRVLSGTEAAGTGFGRMVHSGKVPVAAGWFVRHGGRITFLKGLGSADGRNLRAMHALIDHVIAEHANSGLIFDFAGGNDPQLARFYGGFGAEQVVYLRALMNRLPAYARWLKP